jgi:hypothetical protein
MPYLPAKMADMMYRLCLADSLPTMVYGNGGGERYGTMLP